MHCMRFQVLQTTLACTLERAHRCKWWLDIMLGLAQAFLCNVSLLSFNFKKKEKKIKGRQNPQLGIDPSSLGPISLITLACLCTSLFPLLCISAKIKISFALSVTREPGKQAVKISGEFMIMLEGKKKPNK